MSSPKSTKGETSTGFSSRLEAFYAHSVVTAINENAVAPHRKTQWRFSAGKVQNALTSDFPGLLYKQVIKSPFIGRSEQFLVTVGEPFSREREWPT